LAEINVDMHIFSFGQSADKLRIGVRWRYRGDGLGGDART